MGLKLKDFTGKEIFEAIEKNGFKILREGWMEADDGNGISACILGQAALNLGIVADGEIDTTLGYDTDYKNYTLINQLNRRNPNMGTAIVGKFDAQIIEEDMGEELSFDNFKNADNSIDYEKYDLIYQIQKDKFIATLDPTQISSNNSDGEERYYKLSWSAAVEMVREYLTPYFDTTFTLAVEDYKELYNWAPPKKV